MDAPDSAVVAPLEKALLSMKILRKSVVLGLRKPHENTHAMQLMVTVLEQIKILMTIRELIFSIFISYFLNLCH